MKRTTIPVMFVFLISAGLLLSACPWGESKSQNSRVIIDPDVVERIKEEGEALVYITLRKSDTPLLEQTTEERMAHAAMVQESVLSFLTEDDFRLTHQFPVTAGLGGYITMSGVNKLAGHPDVLRIELSVGAELAG